MSALVVIAFPSTASARVSGPPRIIAHRAGERRAALGEIVGVAENHVVAPAALYAALAKVQRAVPSFSRQTGLACSACHYQFPALTPFGRQFKLNGYTLSGMPGIVQAGDSAGKESLRLASIPPMSAMIVASVTQTRAAQPGAQNWTTAFPDQFSLFVAGAITPHVGAFTQFTYAASDGAIGIDNVDIRYANRTTLSDRELIYGLTLHNNPTVQDVWNTVPAWGFPFMSSSSAPSSIAGTLIDGTLGQQVVGLGAYSLYDRLLYTELTAYRSSPQGMTMPLDTSAQDVVSKVIPYWRIALQHETPNTSLMLGTFGFDAHLFPVGVSGPRDHYTDVAIDGHVERRHGRAAWIARASVIHEHQDLVATETAGGAASADHTLWTTRASLAWLPNLRHGVTVGWFQTTGTSDALLYAPAEQTGSRTGSPNTRGAIGEVTWNPWQNARLGVQYVYYNRFNGAASAYDVDGGRSAGDNSTLYLYLWTAF
ncbi:MAG TPA: hypothetical protein VFY85_04545 [Gemmatimonadaceae bacterium]|nr:hypothetical protein [Gemmatimonadaceae bacterium]